MGTFGGAGGGVFGGAGGNGTSSAGVNLGTGILIPMLRIAGITTLPGITPNIDQFGELYGLLNDMLASWSCDGHKVYNNAITTYALTAGLKTYTIGPGGTLAGSRPIFITQANVLFPTTPVVRRRLDLLDDEQWGSIQVQDISGAPPYQLFYDAGIDSTGCGTIYLRFQPTTGYSLELYTWEELQDGFTASSDTAIFPPGYIEAIKWNGALRVAALYPLESKLHPLAVEMARTSLRALQILNAHSPELSTDPGFDGGGGYGWLTGGFR